MLIFLVNSFDIFVEIMFILILIRVILSWIIVQNRFKDFVFDLTESILFPVRKILPKMIFLDLSPIVAILLLNGLKYLIHYLTKIPY